MQKNNEKKKQTTNSINSLLQDFVTCLLDKLSYSK